ncbi:hypothetical protein [Leptospira kirschneri]|uniref:hypothetical protein n=1 Tax=Leptospira kirschneri TaxID=29507 RepID=UPI00117A6D7F|nr:hypothetical protein [Leptospira kirschneri]
MILKYYKLYLVIILFFNVCSKYTIKGPIFESKLLVQECYENKIQFYIDEVYINDKVYSETLREYISNELKSSINEILLKNCLKGNVNKFYKSIPIKITISKFQLIERKRFLFYVYVIFPIVDLLFNNSIEYSYSIDLSIAYTTLKDKQNKINTFSFSEKRIAGIFELNKSNEKNVFSSFRFSVTNFILNSILGGT